MKMYAVVRKDAMGFHEEVVCATSEQMLKKSNPDSKYVSVEDITATTLTDGSIEKIDNLMAENGFTDNDRLMVKTLLEAHMIDRIDGRRGRKKKEEEAPQETAQEVQEEAKKEVEVQETAPTTTKRGRKNKTKAA